MMTCRRSHYVRRIKSDLVVGVILARRRFYKHRVELTVVPNESHAIVTYTELSHCQSLGAADLLEGFIKSLECNFHVSSATSNIQNRLVASM